MALFSGGTTLSPGFLANRASLFFAATLTELSLAYKDDVSAVVIDLGTHTTKAGYAGEDTPRCVIPSVRLLLQLRTIAPLGNVDT